MKLKNQKKVLTNNNYKILKNKKEQEIALFLYLYIN